MLVKTKDYDQLVTRYCKELDRNPDNFDLFLKLHNITASLITQKLIPRDENYYRGIYQNKLYYYGAITKPRSFFQGVALPDDGQFKVYDLSTRFRDENGFYLLDQPRISIFKTDKLGGGANEMIFLKNLEETIKLFKIREDLN